MNIILKNKVGALFKLKVHKGDGIAIQETPWFHNEVLDAGLDQMSTGTWISGCCVGSGNSLPVSTQVQLDAFIARTTKIQTSSTSRNTGVEPYYISNQITWRFAQGVAAGNISEIGLGWGSTQLWNRALIKDISGNPTTITVLSDEYLDVISEVRSYFETAYVGTINLLDKNENIVSTHAVTGKPYIPVSPHPSISFDKISMSVGSGYSGSMGSISRTPDGTLFNIMGGSSYPTPSSVNGEFTLSLDVGNGSHKSLTVTTNLIDISMSIGYQFEINPPITKTSAQIMTYTFSMSWGRYEPT